jgi:sugar diacid utilization regulator
MKVQIPSEAASAQTGGGLAEDPHEPHDLAQDALLALERDARQVGHDMARAVISEVDAIATAAKREPDLVERLAGMSEQSVRTLVDVTREAREPTEHELAFVHELALRRAADAFRVEALIHGVRVGQRVIWEHLVSHVGDAPLAAKAIVVLTEQMLRYTDRLSTALATAYVTTQQARAADHERRRAELMDEILSGRFPYRADTPARLAAFGLDPDEECVVLVAEGCEIRSPSDPIVREAIRAAFERHARRRGARFLVRAYDTDVVAVISPPAAAQAIAEATVRDVRQAQHATLAIGVSGTCPRLGDAAQGNADAMDARAVVQHTGGITAFPDIRLLDYLVARADPSAQRLLPEALHGLLGGFNGRASLLQTLEAYLDSDLSIPATADRLSVHTNTVRYRLDKLEQLTGLDTRRFWDLTELAAALRILVRRAQRDTEA